MLKGRALQWRRGRFLPEAIECFEKALALDEGYAEPLACLADSYRLAAIFGTEPASEAMPHARRLAEKALAMDPSLAEAWGTLGIVADQYEWNHGEAEAMFERALTLDPRLGAVRGQRALYLFLHHDFTREQTRSELERAVRDDPLNGWVLAMCAHILGFLGLHAESLDQSERAFALDRESFFAHWNLVRSHAWIGNYERAIEMSPGLLRVSGRNQWGLGMLAWSLAKAGHAERARAIHDELMARSRSEFVAPFWLAASAASCGLEEEATRQVERAAREHDPLFPWGPLTPNWDQVRALPRFADLAAEVMW